MLTKRWVRPCTGLTVCFVLIFSLSGCDYWPPALQAQIEQLRAEIQTLAAEKSELQSQVDELTKAKRDLQTQVDELNRLNREKTTLITGLQRQVAAFQAKSSKTQKGVSKPAQKSTTRSPGKKSSTTKR
ncbi:MAG: hypothetical protein NNA21_12230 [Nitrospira sp.]|nr:hypothetical protein [Nitrospira sp.]